MDVGRHCAAVFVTQSRIAMSLYDATSAAGRMARQAALGEWTHRPTFGRAALL
jgi:hypothetical protein